SELGIAGGIGGDRWRVRRAGRRRIRAYRREGLRRLARLSVREAQPHLVEAVADPWNLEPGLLADHIAQGVLGICDATERRAERAVIVIPQRRRQVQAVSPAELLLQVHAERFVVEESL